MYMIKNSNAQNLKIEEKIYGNSKKIADLVLMKLVKNVVVLVIKLIGL